MSWKHSAICAAHIAALMGLSPWARSATPATAADLARCAGIQAPDARLACYDTLAARQPDRAMPAAGAVPAATATPTPSPATTPARPATAATPAPAPTAAGDARNFGLTQTQLHSTPEGPAAIEARVAKIIDNRLGQVYVVLDNGQTWTFTDADVDTRLGSGDPVTIKRASLGSFLMMTQSKRSYHVRRMR